MRRRGPLAASRRRETESRPSSGSYRGRGLSADTSRLAGRSAPFKSGGLAGTSRRLTRIKAGNVVITGAGNCGLSPRRCTAVSVFRITRRGRIAPNSSTGQRSAIRHGACGSHRYMAAFGGYVSCSGSPPSSVI